MWTDLKLACRQLLKTPGFTFIALLTLALGIGANTTAFTVLNRLLLRASPYPDADRFVEVISTSAQDPYLSVSPADYCDIRDQNTVFEYIACRTPAPSSLIEVGHPPVEVQTMMVSADYFHVVGILPALGRSFTEDEEARRESETILSNAYWRNHFGSDPTIIGRTLRIDAKVVTVVGVLPPSMDNPDILTWGPKDLWMLDHPDVNRTQRVRAWYFPVARLKPGVSLDRAQAELKAISARLAHDFPKEDSGKSFRAARYDRGQSDPTTSILCWLTMAVTLAVLAIVCVNLANLQLVRATGRGRDHAIRLALGSSRAMIVRQQLMESVLLSLVGGALGLLLAKWGNESAERYLARYFTNVDFPLDVRVIAFAFGASALTGILFGFMPAWMASGADVNTALKQSSRGTTADGSRHRLRQVLIVTELALALTVLAGAGYFILGMQRLLHRDLGWRPDNLLTGELVLSPEKYGDDADPRAKQFGDRLRAQILALPAVTQVALAYSSPIWGYDGGGPAGGYPFVIEGQPLPAAGKELRSHLNGITPHFFDTLGMRLLQGRDFTEADKAGSPNVAIINETMAKRFWPNESPIGKRIGNPDPANLDWREVVGVVHDSIPPYHLGPPKEEFEVYRPFAQNPHRWINFIVHSAQDPAVIEDDVRRAVAQVDPDVAVAWLQTAKEAINGDLMVYSIVGQMLTQMAVLGLLLSAVGIYGVIANLAAERTQEIGIRMALGAQPQDVLWLVLRNGLRLAALGTATGLALSAALIYTLGRMMPEVPGRNVWVVAGLAVALALVALLACWLPARRATKVNPIEALRAE